MNAAQAKSRQSTGRLRICERALARCWAPLLLGLLAVAVRALPLRRVFRKDGVFLHGFDSFYHLRRIQFSVDHFPASLGFDPFINFPHGARPIWPPTFDWLMALTLRPFAGAGQPESVERLVVWLPPLLGGATVVALYWMARRYFGQTVALLAAAVLVILPAHFFFSQLGFVDHHVLVTFSTTLMLAAAMAAVASRAAYNVRTTCWLGLAMVFSLLVWPGALLHLVVIQVALVARILSARDRDVAVAWAHRFALAHGVACLGVLPLCAGNHWERWGTFSPLVLSNFQPVYLFAGAFCFFAVAELWRRHAIFAQRRMRWLCTLALGGVLLGAGFALFPVLRVGWIDALTWFSKDEAFQAVVVESSPLLLGKNGVDWAFAESWFGKSIYILPVAFVFLVFRSRGRADRMLFLWWAVALCVATLNQRRFMNSYAVAHALLCAWFLCELFELARVWLSARPRALRGGVALGLALFVLSFWPVLGRYREHWENLRLGLEGKAPVLTGMAKQIELVVGTARWLKENSPEPKGEGYSVMGAWGDGHILNYIARRPVVQDNFGDDIGEENFALAEQYFSSETEDAALKLLDQTRSRYVLVRSTGSGHPIAPYSHKSLFTRLYRLKGAYGQFKSEKGLPLESVTQLLHHRLIYESPPLVPGRKRRNSFCKLFELVRGAAVAGNARSGAVVWMTMRMKTRYGGAFDFVARAKASEAGRYHFRIPYSNEKFSPDVQVEKSFGVRSAGKLAHLVIREQDVRRGRQLEGPDLRF